MRIGEKQRAVLEWATGSVYQDLKGNVTHLPAYMGGELPHPVAKFFIYERQFENFCRSLEGRGWIRIEKRWFVYITDEGKLALSSAATPTSVATDGQGGEG
jgi:hypothetical protein